MLKDNPELLSKVVEADNRGKEFAVNAIVPFAGCLGGDCTKTDVAFEVLGIFPFAKVLKALKYADEAAEVTKSGEKGGLNLFKWGSDTTTTSKGWKDGDFMLHLKDQGSPKANWKQNSGHLREQIGKGNLSMANY